MEIKIIKTEDEYQAALLHLEGLMDAAPGSPEEDELELLSLVLEKYEKEHYPIDPPHPVDAILFRMDQQGLEPKDLIPYLGSQSKVSEVLNRKRPLSLTMIRKLHAGLGIPLEVLVQQAESLESPFSPFATGNINADRFHFNFSAADMQSKTEAYQIWSAAISSKIPQEDLPTFQSEQLDASLFKELMRLSAYSAGPRMAEELLNKIGISLVIQKPPLEVDLDGACLISPEKPPVIALTLRSKDLVDFWFVLFHLLAHLSLKQDEAPAIFFDSLGHVFDDNAPAEEKRVNEFLRELLAPLDTWALMQSYLNSGNAQSLEQAFHAYQISPEMLECWLRLENEGKRIYPLNHIPKKVSDKLEVYG